MMRAISSPTRRIELLLTTLDGEQHARRALLSELCEELASAQLFQVHEEAENLLRLLDGPVPADLYDKKLEGIVTRFYDATKGHAA